MGKKLCVLKSHLDKQQPYIRSKAFVSVVTKGTTVRETSAGKKK